MDCTTAPLGATTKLALLASAAAGQTQYSIKRIGPPARDAGSYAGALNAAAQVTGQSSTTGADHAYFYDNGSAEVLPDFGGRPISRGSGISPAGDVVGNSTLPPFTFAPAALWIRSDDGTWQVTNLGLLPGHYYALASAINGTGLIVGGSGDGGAIDRAVVWELDNSQALPLWGLTDLGGVPGALYTFAADVNAAGQIVGWSGSAALVWTKDEDGTWVFALLGGLPGGDGGAGARGINADGVIVGQAGAAGGQRHAVRWDDNGITDLGPEGIESQANAVNAAGVIVGSGGSAGSADTGALLWAGNSVTNLQNLIPPGTAWDLREASDINDAGQIVGTGILDGFFHSYLLTPVELGLSRPVPGTAGKANSFTVSGAGSSGFVLWYSFSGGETAIEGCGDVPLNLGSPAVLAVAAPGVTTVTVNIPDVWSGQTLYFQASKSSGCGVSNVVQYTFP